MRMMDGQLQKKTEQAHLRPNLQQLKKGVGDMNVDHGVSIGHWGDERGGQEIIGGVTYRGPGGDCER